MNESDRVGVHKFERDASRLEAWRVSESPVLDSGAEGGGPQMLLLGGGCDNRLDGRGLERGFAFACGSDVDFVGL